MGDNSNLDIPLNEKVRAIPGFFGINLEEQAPYEVIKSDREIEIRNYWPQARASIKLTGDDDKEIQKETFNCLAVYLFGENKSNEKIQMTTPILLEEKSGKMQKEWEVSFILPQQYLIKTAPAPKNKRILINERPVHMVASIGYTGINNPEKIKQHKDNLKKWLKRRPWYILESEFQIAQFDGPLTIPFFRKNEIHVEVRLCH